MRNTTFSVSINRLFPGQKLGMPPEEKRWARYNSSFHEEEHTPDSLLVEIEKGHSFTCSLGRCQGLHCGTWCAAEECKGIPGHCGRPAGYRHSHHFKSSQVLALDDDGRNLSIDELLADSFIAQYASFIYPTISWSPDNRKWRIVFVATEAMT